MNSMNRSLSPLLRRQLRSLSAGSAPTKLRAQSAMAGSAVIGEGNVTSIPEGFRHWTFLGAPLTPNGLNGGAADEPSGRGFFAKSFAGIDMMVKDRDRFADTNGWGFFNFGHHEPPYAETATAASAAECASCHADNVTTEMVFGKFYPILRQN